MAFLLLLFTVALSLCVVGLVVIVLAAILGRLRDTWKLSGSSVPTQKPLAAKGDTQTD
jgi:hypothetical protein